MAISALSPKSLARKAEAASNSRAMKALDWLTAVGFGAYAAYLLVSEWPHPSAWAICATVAAFAGAALAWFDWKPKLQAAVESRLRGRFVRRRA